jgi:hypothetical protein
MRIGSKQRDAPTPGSKTVSLATRKLWMLGGLVLSLLTIVVAAKYGEQLQGIFRGDRGRALTHIARPATWQPFDKQLSLRMPVSFGPATDFPLEKLPVAVRERVQKMTQRTAYFNGVYIVVMKMTNSLGSKGNVEDILSHAFSKSVNPPSPNMPKINLTRANGVYESGAIRFPAVFGNSQGQMTVVAIESESDEAFWCISAWGRPQAADLAEKTAREFAFK